MAHPCVERLRHQSLCIASMFTKSRLWRENLCRVVTTGGEKTSRLMSDVDKASRTLPKCNMTRQIWLASPKIHLGRRRQIAYVTHVISFGPPQSVGVQWWRSTFSAAVPSPKERHVRTKSPPTVRQPRHDGPLYDCTRYSDRLYIDCEHGPGPHAGSNLLVFLPSRPIQPD